MKTRILALAAAFCMLFTGCVPITLSVEDLMRPPKLSESQRQVYDALMSALGTSASNVSLRYPRSGDNRSAFTFFDLDDDGVEEALVFYSLADAEDELYINVMEQGETGWYSVYDTPGAGSGVESVEFVPVSGSDGWDVLIGWTADQNGVGQLTVMNYQENRLESLFQSRYSRYTYTDLNNDGLQELLLVTMSSSGGKPFATLVTQKGDGIKAVSNLPLNVNMTSFGQLHAGWVGESSQGLIVDGYEGQNFTSEIFVINNNLFVLPFAEDSDFYKDVSRRQGIVYSRDVDDDGVIELPMQDVAPGKTGLYLTTYCRMDDGMEAVPVRTAFVNDSEGYIFYLPDQWVGQVTVSQSKTGETVFKEYDAETEQGGKELLHIKVYSEKDYQDKFDIQNYRKIGQRGNFMYYASIGTGAELSITFDELEDLFQII